MKKTLLLALSLMVSAAYAQQMPSLPQVKAERSTLVPDRKAPQAQLVGEKGVRKVSRKADENVLLYAKPAGSLYRHWDKDLRGYGSSCVIVAPWEEYTFNNLSTNAESTVWQFLNPSTGLYVDVNNYRNEDFSYTSQLEPGYYSYVPFLLNAEQTDTFAIAKASNYYWAESNDYTTIVQTDSVATLGFLDDHQSAYGWGSMDNGYLYGSGTLTTEAYGVGTCIGFVQYYPKPISPLYVEEIFMNIMSQTKKPLADGVELTLTIFDTETDAEIAVMKATNADIVDLGADMAGTSSYAKLTGEYETYRLTFAQKEVDEFGYELQVPVVIENAFYVQIEGIAQEGVEFGMMSNVINPEDADVETGLFAMYFPDMEEGQQYGSFQYGDCALPLTFTCMFDNVIVATDLSYEDDNGDEVAITNANYLVVSNDGTQQGVDCGDGSFLAGVYVYTAQPWFGSEGEEFYFNAEDLPDWISMLNVDDSDYADLSVNYVTVTCDPLPEGVDGRFAVIHIMGRGKTSADPIYVIQGEVDYDLLGIASPKVDNTKVQNGIFNLAGQKVTKAKGIVVKNGKKVIVK